MRESVVRFAVYSHSFLRNASVRQSKTLEAVTLSNQSRLGRMAIAATAKLTRIMKRTLRNCPNDLVRFSATKISVNKRHISTASAGVDAARRAPNLPSGVINTGLPFVSLSAKTKQKRPNMRSGNLLTNNCSMSIISRPPREHSFANVGSLSIVLSRRIIQHSDM